MILCMSMNNEVSINLRNSSCQSRAQPWGWRCWVTDDGGWRNTDSLSDCTAFMIRRPRQGFPLNIFQQDSLIDFGSKKFNRSLVFGFSSQKMLIQISLWWCKDLLQSTHSGPSAVERNDLNIWTWKNDKNCLGRKYSGTTLGPGQWSGVRGVRHKIFYIHTD